MFQPSTSAQAAMLLSTYDNLMSAVGKFQTSEE